jgi:hypothetical protein
VLSSGTSPFADVSRRTVPLAGVEDLLVDLAGEGAAPPPLHGVVVPGT